MSKQASKHTPGPWGQERDGSVVMAGQVAITPTWCGPESSSREEKQANARLIAAAPDLLAALEALVGKYDQGFTRGSQVGHVTGADIEALRAAIARAKGEA